MSSPICGSDLVSINNNGVRMRLLLRQGVRGWVGLSVLLLALCTLGCGSPIGTVTGKIYYKNVPLKGGNVTFVSSDKTKSLISPIAEDGSYRIEKVPIGIVKVLVETNSLAKKSTLRTSTPPPGMKDGNKAAIDPKEMARRYVAIPLNYSDVEKSGLEYTVQGGSQTHDIKLPN